MTSSFSIRPTVNFNTPAFAGSNISPSPFSTASTHSTADLLLRVAASRQFVRAVQAMRRR